MPDARCQRGEKVQSCAAILCIVAKMANDVAISPTKQKAELEFVLSSQPVVSSEEGA